MLTSIKNLGDFGEPLEGIRILPSTLDEILGGGQAFRWKRLPPPHPDVESCWEGFWGTNRARLAVGPEGRVRVHWIDGGGDPEIIRYLGGAVDFDQLADALPWRSDPILESALSRFPGLRILRQPPAETLLTFLLSSTKSIPQISALCDTLATRFGPVLNGDGHGLPDWGTLARIPEPELRACGCGFRARYIAGTARALSANPGWLDDLESLPTEALRARLCELPGVGPKIADCVALFAYGRLEAFPIDTWISRILRDRYRLESWSPRQLQDFARIHFGPAAGLAQQYLFAARKQ